MWQRDWYPVDTQIIRKSGKSERVWLKLSTRMQVLTLGRRAHYRKSIFHLYSFSWEHSSHLRGQKAPYSSTNIQFSIFVTINRSVRWCALVPTYAVSEVSLWVPNKLCQARLTLARRTRARWKWCIDDVAYTFLGAHSILPNLLHVCQCSISLLKTKILQHGHLGWQLSTSPAKKYAYLRTSVNNRQ